MAEFHAGYCIGALHSGYYRPCSGEFAPLIGPAPSSTTACARFPLHDVGLDKGCCFFISMAVTHIAYTAEEKII